MPGSCDQRNDISGSIKVGEYPDQISDNQFYDKDWSPWSYFIYFHYENINNVSRPPVFDMHTVV